MDDEQSLTPQTIRNNWADYVQSPAQLAFSRLSKFPPGSGSKLNEVLGIREGERILEIGSGLGILGSRISATGRPELVVGCEINEQYLTSSPPEELLPEQRMTPVRGDGFELPFPDNSFDRVMSHAVVTLMPSADWRCLHDEIRRVLKNRGIVTHMDNIHNECWEPESVRPDDRQQQREQEYKQLIDNLHRELDTGYGHTAHDLPDQLESLEVTEIDVTSYSWTLNPGSSRWEKRERDTFMGLWRQFEFDRLTRIRRLLNETNRMTADREQLLSQYQEEALNHVDRRASSFESNQPSGWYSSTTLVCSGTVQ